MMSMDNNDFSYDAKDESAMSIIDVAIQNDSGSYPWIEREKLAPTLPFPTNIITYPLVSNFLPVCLLELHSLPQS